MRYATATEFRYRAYATLALIAIGLMAASTSVLEALAR
jgi:hypothetical protein